MNPNQPINPTKSQNRLIILDILRGFAVLGILFMNIYSYSGAWRPGASLSTLDQVLVQVGRFFIEAKFYSLFSFLFGVGVAMQMLKAQKRDTKFVPFFLRRMFFLFIIGLIHGIFFWPGDILAAYALLGTLLLLFRNRSNGALLGVALLCFLVGIFLATPTPGSEIRAVFVEATSAISQRANGGQAIYASGNYLQITVQRLWQTVQSLSNLLYTGWYILPMMLMGLYAGRRRIFEDVAGNKAFIWRVTIVGLIVGLIFNALFVWFSNPNGLFGIASLNWIPTGYGEMFRRTARIIGAPALALFYAGAITLFVDYYSAPTPSLPRKAGEGANKSPFRWEGLRKAASLPGEGLYRLAPVGRMALSNYLLQTLIATMIFYNYGLGFFGQVSISVAWLIAVIILAFQIQFSAWWLERYRFGPAEWLWRSLSYGKLQAWRIAGKDDGSDSTPSRVWLGLAGLVLLVGLCYGLVNAWQNISEAEQAEIVGSLPSLRPTPTATPRPRVTATPTPIRATPAVEPVSRNPGPAAQRGDLWSLALAFDAELAYDEVAHLSAPPYNGRHFASPGGIAAGNYIAQKFEEYGLRPAGDDNTYFQPFTVGGYTWLTESPSLEIIAPNGQATDYHSPEQFAPLVTRYMGAGNGEGPVVWANDCAYNDFDNIDVVGKIVFCRDELWYARQADVGRNALEHGAVGLLLLADEGARPIDLKAPNREVWLSEPIPSLRIGSAAAENLLLGSGLSLDDLTVAFASFPLSTTAKVSVELETDNAPQARNVLGVLPGRDPEYADEIIIIGAHYDHMGQDPNGVTWAGANDDASGVAVLLELARSWQEAGFVPRRTILFSAWDAEEAGLLGSSHYVENWRYPLTATIAMLQLDMVGAGEDTLYIDGDGPLVPQLQAIAASVGVTATNLHIGRSDHAPFAEAGIPANMLIWFGGESTEATAHYHRPDDAIDVIEPDKLQAVGRITALTALALAEGEPALKDLLGVRLAALHRNNSDLFLATSAEGQRPFDQAWFNALQRLKPAEISFDVGDPLIVGRTATATVRLNVAYPYGEEMVQRSATLPTRFVHEAGAWRWDGPALQQIQPDDGFAILYPPGQKEKAVNLSRVASERYRAISAQLGLPAQIEAPLILYPDSQSLRADTDLTLPAQIDSYIIAGTDTPAVKLVYSPGLSVTERFTATLVQLALAQTGLTEADMPWLWHGLPHLVSAQGRPIESQKQYLPGLSQSLLAESDAPAADSLNWAAVDYLQRQIGWQGIGQLAQAVGAGQNVDTALNEVAGMTLSDFEIAWHSEWQDRLQTAHTALNNTLSQRQTALLSQQEAPFLATSASTDPTFINEETAWFDDFSQKSLSDFNLSAQPLAFYDNGDILAQVEMRYQLASDSRAVNLSYETLFQANGAEYLWAGPPLETLQAENFVIRYPAEKEELAQGTLQQAQAIYQQIQADFGINAPAPFAIKLYPSAEALTASGPAVTGSVKQLVSAETTPASLRPAIAEGMSRYLLAQAGVDSVWLMAGLPQLEAGRVNADDAGAINARNFPALIEAVEKDKLLPLTAFESPTALSSAEAEIASAQSWDMVRYLLDRYGGEAVQSYLKAKAKAEAKAETDLFRRAFGISQNDFEAEWRESVLRGHTRPEWVELAQKFDAEQAEAHITELGSQKYAGRQAGSAGERLAAEYIAGQLATYGLSPAGEDGTFFQTVPLSYPILLSAPRLTPLDSAGNPLDVFRYREDFSLAQEGAVGGGEVTNDVVWIRGEDYGAIRLQGQIVLRRPTAGLKAEIEQAISHGAGGLILVGERKEKGLVIKDLSANSLDIPLEGQIPVLELTSAGLTHLLEFSQFSFADLNGSAPAVPLDLRLNLSVPLETRAVSSSNVLAMLPGTNPELNHETVIVSAHYDHVGDDPDDEICLPDGGCTTVPGLAYPGLNDDLSGVATVLELARLWQTEGYQPQRNILFAFWGGQEIDSAGARQYVISPTVPLTATAAMIELEGVGGGTGFYLQGQGDPVKEGVLRFSLNNAANQVEGRLDLVRSDRPADQEIFRRRRIPSMLLYWKGAETRNFPAEFEDEIDLGVLQSTGKMTGLLLMTLGR